MEKKKLDAATEAEQTAEREETAAGETGDNLVQKLKKPYVFDGKEYTELDLSGLENATGGDLIAVERILRKRGNMDPLMEMSPDLAALLAARMSGLPEEFYKGLPIHEMVRLKTTVSGFLYGGDGDN